MTVSTTQSRVSYAGNGATVLFAVPFPFILDSYLIVIRTNTDTLVETTLTLNSAGANGYTVSGAGAAAGAVLTVTAPAINETLSIIRDVPATQEADFVANDPFKAETFEDALDKLTMIAAQASNDADRSLKLFEADTDGSGRYDANGNRIAALADGVNPTDAVTVQQVTSLGSGSFIAAGAGAVIRTMQNKARDIVSVKDFGAVGDGVTDDTAAFALAAATGGLVALTAGESYLLSSGISFVDGTGFVCDGVATILLKTGAGGFTNTSFGGTRTALDRCVFSMVGTSGNRIEGVAFETDGTQECCLYPIRTSGGFTLPGKGLFIDRVSFTGFSMGVLVGLNTVGTAGYQVGAVEATNCGSSQGIAYWGAGSGQLTVLEIDNDMVAAVPSVPGDVDELRGTNILHTAAALADYGQQTDLLNVAGISGLDRKGPTVRAIYADGVGEAVDLFCSGAAVLGGRVRNVHNSVVKFVHGAQDNRVAIDVVESFGLCCVAFAGSTSLAGHTQRNVCHIGTVKGCGDAGVGPATANVPIVLFQENGGAIGTCLPRNNLCTIDHAFVGANCDYIARDNCSVNNTNNNLVRLTRLEGAPATSFSSTVFSTNMRARYLSASPARLSIGSTQVLSTTVAATIQYQTVQSDTDGLADTGTFTIRPKFPGWYDVYAQVRVSGQNAADYATLRIQKNASTISQKSAGYATGSVEICLDVRQVIYISENDVGTAAANLTIQATHVGAATVNALNTASMSFFEVTPVAG